MYLSVSRQPDNIESKTALQKYGREEFIYDCRMQMWRILLWQFIYVFPFISANIKVIYAENKPKKENLISQSKNVTKENVMKLNENK